ncbi:unnamed protein product [Caenorhabditis sp. 36 PRJEB53466]|nr:unnamed protein product [Caenorhabditis sp. 36 PRJEB53466]
MEKIHTLTRETQERWMQIESLCGFPLLYINESSPSGSVKIAIRPAVVQEDNWESSSSVSTNVRFVPKADDSELETCAESGDLVDIRGSINDGIECQPVVKDTQLENRLSLATVRTTIESPYASWTWVEAYWDQVSARSEHLVPRYVDHWPKLAGSPGFLEKIGQ